VNDDLRARLAEILANATAGFVPKDFERLNTRHGEGDGGHIYDGACALCRGEIETLVDAMMPVIEERLWYAGHTHQGKCTWCTAPLDAPWKPDRQPHAHFMHCKYYTGPLEHHRRDSSTSTISTCTCGRFWRENAEVCPDAGETWRGPLPARGGLR
jgi:hypothetical protein